MTTMGIHSNDVNINAIEFMFLEKNVVVDKLNYQIVENK